MSKEKQCFKSGDLVFKGDESVHVLYSNFAKIQAQAHDITVMCAHITGLQGVSGFDIGGDGEPPSLRPDLLVTFPHEVGAGLAKALILQLNKLGFDLESVFAPEGISLIFETGDQKAEA